MGWGMATTNIKQSYRDVCNKKRREEQREREAGQRVDGSVASGLAHRLEEVGGRTGAASNRWQCYPDNLPSRRRTADGNLRPGSTTGSSYGHTPLSPL